MVGAVAVAALLIWGGTMTSRHFRYRELAKRHNMYYEHHHEQQPFIEAEVLRTQQEVDSISTEFDKGDPVPVSIAGLEHLKKLLKFNQNLAAFHANMADYQLQLKQKYEYASSHPWVRVLPDRKSPPEPTFEP
jgi:hypothetical protein